MIMANEKIKYGLTVSGIIRVFRKDKDIQGKNNKVYTVTDVWFNVSEKNAGEDWFNISINLLFPRNADRPENNTLIHIKEAYPLITGSGKYRRVAYYVKEWDYVDQGKGDN